MLDDEENYPPDLRRRSTVTDSEHIWSYASLGSLLAAVVMLFVFFSVQPLVYLVPVPFVVLMLVCGLFAVRARSQAIRTLEANSYRLCEYCAFGLANLPRCGICPECGRKYTWESAEAWWNAKYHPKEPDWMQSGD